MNTCNKCNCYTRSNSPVCYDCYVKENQYVEGFSNYSFERTPLKFIKGHIGEAIIQNLFTSLGFTVFRYGLENNLTYVNEYLVNSSFSDLELGIFKNRPDLLVLNKDKACIYFLEVKYRWNGKFEYKELGENYQYSNAYLILLSKGGFKCIRVSELKEIESISPDTLGYDLSENTEFNLDKGFVRLIEAQSLKIYESINSISHIDK